MSRKDFIEICRALAAAWTNRDYQKAVSFFAEEVRYADSLNYSFDNNQDLLKFFEDDQGFAQSCIMRKIIFDEAEQTGACEYTYEGTHRYHGVALVKIANGKIAFWREYQHRSELDWQELWTNVIF